MTLSRAKHLNLSIVDMASQIDFNSVLRSSHSPPFWNLGKGGPLCEDRFGGQELLDNELNAKKPTYARMAYIETEIKALQIP